eukprot:TRINITY_DN7491_c0_g1_i6.p1 TRINITY_DN7491_c0_g1~~TRINITY_DN7491_c0_g1_i6.p1  ORF type:complete len:542 (+),score=19.24 TRINITY_DN7491_c0_g1_i6:64-1689(+)
MCIRDRVSTQSTWVVFVGYYFQYKTSEMRTIRCLLLGLGILICSLLSAQSRLQVISPPSLKKYFETSGHPQAGVYFDVMQYARFKWEQTLRGTITYQDIPDCTKFANFTEMKANKTLAFLIIHRTACDDIAFASKAQDAGADLLIFVDSDPVNKRTKISWAAKTTVDPDLIKIPVIMISKDEGDRIINEVKGNSEHQVLANVRISHPKEHNLMTVDAWIHTGSRASYESLKTYLKKANDYEGFVAFSPLYLVFEPTSYVVKLEGNDCIESGTLCTYDPDAEGPLNGRASLHEAIRQYIIWKEYPQVWWKYMMEFYASCIQNGVKSAEEFASCSNQTIQKVGLNATYIAEQWTRSFRNSDPVRGDNIILRLHQERNKGRVTDVPTFWINGYQLESEITTRRIAKAICDNLVIKPKYCSCDHFASDCGPDGKPRRHLREQRINPFWIGVLVGTLMVFCCVFYYVYRRVVRRRMKEAMEAQIADAVAVYMKFQNDGSNGASKSAGPIQSFRSIYDPCVRQDSLCMYLLYLIKQDHVQKLERFQH